jgi:predicted dehydrogenase
VRAQERPDREELDEFADAVRGDGEPEMDGEKSTRSLAVLLAGIKSAREGRGSKSRRS